MPSNNLSIFLALPFTKSMTDSATPSISLGCLPKDRNQDRTLSILLRFRLDLLGLVTSNILQSLKGGSPLKLILLVIGETIFLTPYFVESTRLFAI